MLNSVKFQTFTNILQMLRSYVSGYGVNSLPSFSGNFMSDPMLNAARQIGSQFAVQQKEKVFFSICDLYNTYK